MNAATKLNLHLLVQLTKRDILSRYRGSLLGVLWSVLTPLFMLAVYTLVFGSIFKARWSVPEEGNVNFALILFCGLTAYNIFAETISRAPGIIVGNPNYIKKVVFPLAILPITVLGSALMNAAIGMGIILVAQLLLSGTLHWTIIYLPIVLLPLILFALGLSWFLAALGVYVRDVVQVVPVFVTAMLFLTPVFYPTSALPQKIQFLGYFNPLGYVVEDVRRIILWGYQPNWSWLGFGLLLGIVSALIGYLWFQKTRSGFADVV